MAKLMMQRTQTAGNPDKWTLSVWVKKSKIAADMNIFQGWVDGSNAMTIQFGANDEMQFNSTISGSSVGRLKTTRRFRDPTAWYHFTFVYDSANGTAGDRMQIWTNGVRETAFDVNTVPSSGQDTILNRSGDKNNLFCYDYNGGAAAGRFDGSFAQMAFFDGQAYTASNFGSFNGTDGIWEAKGDSILQALTFGTNGFLLTFENSSYLGYDYQTSARSTTNDFSTTGTGIQTQDNASNNFCTLNPLYSKVGVTYNFSNGNNVLDTSGGSGWHQASGTLGAVTGKWYYEGYANYSPGAYNTALGWGSTDYLNLSKADGLIGATISKPSFGIYDVGNLMYSTDSVNSQTTSNYFSSWASGDYLMFAADLDNGRFYYGKNGTWDATSSSNPVAGSGGYSFTPNGHTYIPMMALYYQDVIVNFGNGFFGTTSAGATNADDNGHGVFKYDVPAGFYAICTKNIKEFG